MDKHREGIEDDESIPPWEQPGCFRMDCEPHRGTLLWWLGWASLIFGILAPLPWSGCGLGLFGIPLGLCRRHMAKADLAKMRAGLMDPHGEAVTKSAESLGTGGLVCGVIGTVVWGALYLIAWRVQGHPPLW